VIKAVSCAEIREFVASPAESAISPLARRKRGTATRDAAHSSLPQPPLTAAGILNYTGVLAASEVTIEGTLPTGNTTANVTYFIIDTARKTVVGQVILPDAVKQNNSVSVTVKVPSAAAAYAIGTFSAAGDFQASSFLQVTSLGDQVPRGAVGPAGR
jgi:hypothetical protein